MAFRRLWPALAAAGCSIGTQAGPVWDAQTIAGEAPAAACVRSYDVAIAGRDPFLDQQARRLYLERLAERRSRCAPGQQARVQVSGLTVRTERDAFGFTGGDAEEIPRPARVRVATEARVRLVRCRDGKAVEERVGHVAWVPYTGDRYLLDERVAATLDELVARDVRRIDGLLDRAPECPAAGASAAPITATAPANAPASATTPPPEAP